MAAAALQSSEFSIHNKLEKPQARLAAFVLFGGKPKMLPVSPNAIRIANGLMTDAFPYNTLVFPNTSH
jgi:hypothetical protein